MKSNLPRPSDAGDRRGALQWLQPMHSSDTIQLLERWRAGQDEAAAELFARYAGRLVGLARPTAIGPDRRSS